MPPFSSLFLLHHLRRLPPPLTRAMGGGPRTFPGGLNKWQYKRMHEKLAKEKERKLLYQEKQLYQARLRSEIRASLNPNQSNQSQPSNFGPMSAKDHIKSLADRFMKAGAEDLWNESDGPIRAKPDFEESSAPLDLRGIVKERRGFEPRRRGLNGRGNESGSAVRSKPDFEANLAPLELRKVVRGMGSYEQRRGYSTWRRGLEEDGDGGLIRLKISKFLESEKGKEEGEGEEDGGGRRMKGSFAALGNHDAKKKRRVPRGDEEEGEGEGFAEQIQRFREEVKSRELGGSEKRMGYKVKEDSVLTQRRFDEFNISPMTIKALNSAGYVQMTVVQEAAVPVCLEGKDALVKARTGTGKTAAFLLPAIEAVLKAANCTSRHRAPPILVLLLAPTRELAIQLAAEANVLLRYHDGIGVQTLIGGTRFKVDQKRLEENPCQIIVATPGRLLDHIENKSGFSVRLMGLKLLILDEADHLLDLGFRKDIEKIVDCIPRQRQSLLFSATIPKEVRRISQVVLKREHEFVDTVGLAVETPAKVMQSYFVAPLEVQFHLVHHLLKEHVMQEFDYKVILFCTTAMGAALMYDLLRHLKMNVREMHSRKPQLYRTRISDEFRESKRLILVTSDVSARGVNYPDVTLVVQVGIPSDREQYIHRLGRTGREGKNGKGILLIAPWEEFFVQEIGDLPIEKYQLPELNSDMKQKVEESITQVDTSIKEAAYHAWLGYYNSISEIGRDKTMLADLATRFSQSIGLEKPPSLFRKTALKMGLKDVPGIRIRK